LGFDWLTLLFIFLVSHHAHGNIDVSAPCGTSRIFGTIFTSLGMLHLTFASFSSFSIWMQDMCQKTIKGLDLN